MKVVWLKGLQWFDLSRRRRAMGCLNSANVRKFLWVFILIFLGTCIGVLLNRYGLIFEKIRVDVHVNVQQLPKNLSRQYSGTDSNGSSTEYVVPNIVHFIWFGKDREMKFLNYISILSAHKIQKPDAILFHCDNLPKGKWWGKLWREVPLKIVFRQAPVSVHGQKLLHMYHRGDVAKLEILLEYGGIYLDYDVVMLRSMNPLRKYDATLGKEKPPKFIAGIILAKKGAAFLKIWYESYKDNYRPFDWDYNCARVTYELYKNRPDLLHVEPYRLTTPDWKDRHLLWDEVINWSELFVIHCMTHLNWKEYDPENIKELNSTFGEIMRYIYYGSPKMIK